MEELETPESFLAYAKKVAWNMWKDPEAESLAGAAALTAMRTYDPDYGVPTRRWVARITKQYIWDFWRRRAKHPEEHHSETWWKRVAETPDVQTQHLDPADMKLLYEYYVEKWCLDVVARRYGVSRTSAKRRINMAVARLKELVWRS